MPEDLQIRHYSPTTIRIYVHCLAEFAKHFNQSPDQLGLEHIRLYQLFLVKEKQVSRPTYVQIVCAMRFFYTHTLSRKIGIVHIPFPRRTRKLPMILSRDEVKALLEAPHTLRHRTLLAVLYGTGVRVAEVTQLKLSDIDASRHVAVGPTARPYFDFLEICDDRYQHRSLILTSQMPVAHWHEQIGDPTIADSILDRLIHNAYRIELKGESMRKKPRKPGEEEPQ